jgi:hypothetical protein
MNPSINVAIAFMSSGMATMLLIVSLVQAIPIITHLDSTTDTSALPFCGMGIIFTGLLVYLGIIALKMNKNTEKK